jgi:hypothetical protein
LIVNCDQLVTKFCFLLGHRFVTGALFSGAPGRAQAPLAATQLPPAA